MGAVSPPPSGGVKGRRRRVGPAQAEGPQEITVHGKPAAVLVSAEEYRRLAGPRLSFVEFMRAAPLAGIKLDLQRSRSTNRRVRL